MSLVLVDTGPLVALLDRSDAWHEWAVEIFKTLRPPLLTCEAVLAESWHLLGKSRPSRSALATLHASAIIRVTFDFETEATAIWRLLEKYADVPMDYADACMVRIAELHSRARKSGRWTAISAFTDAMVARQFHSSHRDNKSELHGAPWKNCIVSSKFVGSQ